MDRMNEWLVTGERPLPHFLTSFAKSASGSSKDDEDEDDSGDDDDDDSDDDGDEADDLADLTDEELREELKKEREKATRAAAANARRRKRERKARDEASAKKPAAKGKGDDDEDLDTVRENARREGESAGTLRAKKAEAKSALATAGVNPARLARAVGLLNLDELDLDDDGLDGIDEAIDELKADWPELFAKVRRRRGSVAGEGDRDGDKGSRGKELTPSQRQAALVTGRR